MKKYFLTKCNALIILGFLLPAFLNAQIPQDFIFWKFSAGAFHNAPFVNDSVVYCSSSDGNFYALNINNGTEIWNYKSGHPSYSNPALSNGVICFEADERLYGLETKTGKLLWSYVASDKLPTPGSPTGYHHSSPVIYNNIAYYGDEWGNLNGININTGELVFHYTTKTVYKKASDKFIRSTAAIKDDIIYIGDYGRNIYAISLKDSSEKWIHKIESPKWDGSIVSEIVIKDNVLYFGGYNNTFSPIDLNTGNPIWSFTDPNTFLPSTPLFYEDNVIMGTTINSNKIHCLKIKDGKTAWSTQAKGIFFVKPIIYQDSILIMNSTEPFGDNIGVLYFINCKTGIIINEFHLPKATESSPIIVGDKLIIGRNDGMYAIDFKQYLKDSKRSFLKFDNTLENVKIKKNEALKVSSILENTGNFCDSLKIITEIEGDEAKSNITFFGMSNLHLKPGDKLNFGIRAKADDLNPGVYKIKYLISSKKQPELQFEKYTIITVDIVAGIKNFNTKKNLIEVFPNPSSNGVFFKGKFNNGAADLLKIYATDGKLLYYRPLELNNAESIYFWNGCDNNGNILGNGLYIYVLKTKNSEINGKILLNR